MVYDSRNPGAIQVDKFLTGISVGWPNGDLVGERLFPSVRVGVQSDKYPVFGREQWGVDVGGDYRAPGTAANEVTGLALSTDTYFAQEHALAVGVADEEVDINTSTDIDPIVDATELVTARVLLIRERAMQTMVGTAANYASGNSTTLSGTAQWNDYVNSAPISDWRTGVRAMHAKLFIEPNTAVIPYQVMSQLMDHPDFIERIKYSERGVLTAEIIAAIFNIGSVIVPGVGHNTANLGQTATLAYLWGKDVIMAYVPARPGKRIPAFAYEFTWPIGGQVQQVDRWYEQVNKRRVIRMTRRYDLKLVAQDAALKAIGGYLIKTAVA
jgi:hypothetical protein